MAKDKDNSFTIPTIEEAMAKALAHATRRFIPATRFAPAMTGYYLHFKDRYANAPVSTLKEFVDEAGRKLKDHRLRRSIHYSRIWHDVPALSSVDFRRDIALIEEGYVEDVRAIKDAAALLRKKGPIQVDRHGIKLEGVEKIPSDDYLRISEAIKALDWPTRVRKGEAPLHIDTRIVAARQKEALKAAAHGRHEKRIQTHFESKDWNRFDIRGNWRLNVRYWRPFYRLPEGIPVLDFVVKRIRHVPVLPLRIKTVLMTREERELKAAYLGMKILVEERKSKARSPVRKAGQALLRHAGYNLSSMLTVGSALLISSTMEQREAAVQQFAQLPIVGDMPIPFILEDGMKTTLAKRDASIIRHAQMKVYDDYIIREARSRLQESSDSVNRIRATLDKSKDSNDRGHVFKGVADAVKLLDDINIGGKLLSDTLKHMAPEQQLQLLLTISHYESRWDMNIFSRTGEHGGGFQFGSDVYARLIGKAYDDLRDNPLGRTLLLGPDVVGMLDKLLADRGENLSYDKIQKAYDAALGRPGLKELVQPLEDSRLGSSDAIRRQAVATLMMCDDIRYRDIPAAIRDEDKYGIVAACYTAHLVGPANAKWIWENLNNKKAVWPQSLARLTLDDKGHETMNADILLTSLGKDRKTGLVKYRRNTPLEIMARIKERMTHNEENTKHWVRLYHTYRAGFADLGAVENNDLEAVLKGLVFNDEEAMLARKHPAEARHMAAQRLARTMGIEMDPGEISCKITGIKEATCEELKPMSVSAQYTKVRYSETEELKPNLTRISFEGSAKSRSYNADDPA